MLYELEGSEVFLVKGQRFTDLRVTINDYTWGLGGSSLCSLTRGERDRSCAPRTGETGRSLIANVRGCPSSDPLQHRPVVETACTQLVPEIHLQVLGASESRELTRPER